MGHPALSHKNAAVDATSVTTQTTRLPVTPPKQ